jgi:uroporphyrinogen-III decarboxylase
MDVQDVMPFGTPDDVRAEVRRLSDTFGKNGGRMIFSMGNGVTPNIPIENLYALYDEVYRLRDMFE